MLGRIVGKIVCFFKGHKRGKEVMLVADGMTDDAAAIQARAEGRRLYRCPRCWHQTSYKVKQP